MKIYSINPQKITAVVVAVAFAIASTSAVYASPAKPAMLQQDSVKKEKKMHKKGMKMDKKKKMQKDSVGN